MLVVSVLGAGRHNRDSSTASQHSPRLDCKTIILVNYAESHPGISIETAKTMPLSQLLTAYPLFLGAYAGCSMMYTGDSVDMCKMRCDHSNYQGNSCYHGCDLDTHFLHVPSQSEMSSESGWVGLPAAKYVDRHDFTAADLSSKSMDHSEHDQKGLEEKNAIYDPSVTTQHHHHSNAHQSQMESLNADSFDASNHEHNDQGDGFGENKPVDTGKKKSNTGKGCCTIQ